MKKILLATIAVLLVSCSHSTDVTADKRFTHIMGAPSVCTKERLRLYAIDSTVTSRNDRFDLTSVDRGPGRLIGFVERGRHVKLERIIRYNDLGNVWEQLEGELLFKGRSYPFCFYMGNSVYPEGWTRLTDSFEPCR